MTGIYKITNMINNKCYIGQSVNIKQRWKNHKTVNPKDHEYNYPLYQAFRKYGINNFNFEVIEECSIDELNNKEEYWIKYYNSYNNGYNQTLGGNQPTHYNKITPDILSQITYLLANTTLYHSQIAQQFNVSTEMIQGINTGRYWKRDLIYPIRQKVDNSMKEQVQNVNTNKPNIPLEELLLEIYYSSFSAVGRHYNVSDNAVRGWIKKEGIPTLKKDFKAYIETNILHLQPKTNIGTKPKTVIQLDLQGNPIQKFNSISDAARAIGKPNGNGHISMVCRGKRKSCYGYKWKYSD